MALDGARSPPKKTDWPDRHFAVGRTKHAFSAKHFKCAEYLVSYLHYFSTVYLMYICDCAIAYSEHELRA